MAEISPGEYFDTYINMPSAEPLSEEGMDPNIRRWFLKSSPDLLGGVSIGDLIQRMDEAGVQAGLLNSGGAGQGGIRNPHQGGWGVVSLDDFRRSCEKIASAVREYPGRLYGTTNIDPTQGMDAVRMVEIAVKEYDFRAVRMMGALTNCAPNHPLCYPIYTKCIEMDIPVVINVGFPGPLRFAKYQRPEDLDEILVTYPELKVVATHIGHPWHDATVALLQKHANFYLMTSGFVPKYLPPEIIQNLNTRGQDKVMWSADYPIQTFRRCVDEALKLPLREGILRKYMRENALRVFQLA